MAEPFAQAIVPFILQASTIGIKTASSGPVRPIGMMSNTPLISRLASEAFSSEAGKSFVEMA